MSELEPRHRAYWEEGRAAGAAAERARIVAYLRQVAETWTGHSRTAVLEGADDIEAGAHLEERKP